MLVLGNFEKSGRKPLDLMPSDQILLENSLK